VAWHSSQHFPVVNQTGSQLCDRFVGKVSAIGQPTRTTQPSIPSGSANAVADLEGAEPVRAPPMGDGMTP